MKRAIQVLAIALVLGFSSNAFAQKLGHFNSQQLMQKMPEYDSMKTDLTSYVDQIQEQLKSMRAEFEKLSSDYQAKKDQMADLLKANKEKELQDAYTRIQTFSSNADSDVQARQTEWTKKIYEKVRTAVSAVAKDNKYDYILDSSDGNGVVWYATDAEDVSALVEKKLGIKK